MKTAVFFERDGILNHCPQERGRQIPPKRLEEFRPCLHAIEPLARLKEHGFLTIVTTSQPAVSRGELSRSELDLMHSVLRRRLPIDDILFCPYDDPSHPHCKPNPGMFLEAAFRWNVDLHRSFVISDKWFDSKAAQIVGCTSIIVRSMWSGSDHHDLDGHDVNDAVDKLLPICTGSCLY